MWLCYWIQQNDRVLKKMMLSRADRTVAEYMRTFHKGLGFFSSSWSGEGLKDLVLQVSHLKNLLLQWGGGE